MAAAELAASTVELGPALRFGYLAKTGFTLFAECFHALSAAAVLNYKTLFFTKASLVELILEFLIRALVVSSAPTLALLFCFHHFIFWRNTSASLAFTP